MVYSAIHSFILKIQQRPPHSAFSALHRVSDAELPSPLRLILKLSDRRTLFYFSVLIFFFAVTPILSILLLTFVISDFITGAQMGLLPPESIAHSRLSQTQTPKPLPYFHLVFNFATTASGSTNDQL